MCSCSVTRTKQAETSMSTPNISTQQCPHSLLTSPKSQSSSPSRKKKSDPHDLSVHNNQKQGEQFTAYRIILYSQNLLATMNASYSNSRSMFHCQNMDNERGWAQSLPLQEKNHNSNHPMNSTIYKSLAKKNQQAKRFLNLNCMKMQQGQIIGQTCLNFFRGGKENCEESECKGSNIEMLKKEIKYLEQDEMDEKFPKPTSLTFSKNNCITLEHHLINTDLVLPSKLKILSGKTFNGSLISTNKNLNLALSRERPGTSENKQAKKYFSNKKKSARQSSGEESQPAIHNKNHNKYQLIAPFRKYFQSKRNRQNRSCTIKIDEIYGKGLKKLAQFTLQDQ